MATQNIFNNVSAITAWALDSLINNTKMPSRVARRWDDDFAGSELTSKAKIGDTLNIRVPGFYNVRTGAAAQPNGYNDTYVPVTLQQYGVDLLLTSKELTLNVDEFSENVMVPMMADLFQKIDTDIMSNILSFNQFSGQVGTAVTSLTPFLNAFATAQVQSACPVDDKISGMLNPHMQASMIGGLSTLFNPSKEISDQYRNGSLGEAVGMDFFSTANAPSHTVGTFSGTLTVGTGSTDGGNTFVISGMTGNFNPGDKFTVAGVYAVNPRGKDVKSELKQFTVVSQVGTTVTFSPATYLTGPLQNVSALMTASDAIYPWGTSAATALTSGTGQILTVSAMFHEDAIALAIGDIDDLKSVGGTVSSRQKDDRTGLRCRSLAWYNGMGDQALFRLDILQGSALLRQGLGAQVIY